MMRKSPYPIDSGIENDEASSKKRKNQTQLMIRILDLKLQFLSFPNNVFQFDLIFHIILQ